MSATRTRGDQIVDFMRAYEESHGFPPTIRETMREVGLRTPSTVYNHLARLERLGRVRRVSRSERVHTWRAA